MGEDTASTSIEKTEGRLRLAFHHGRVIGLAVYDSEGRQKTHRGMATDGIDGNDADYSSPTAPDSGASETNS